MSETLTACLRETHDGIEVTAHLQPRASRAEIAGLHGAALKLRVTSPPVDGKANEAAARLLAEVFGVAVSAVALTGGATSRHKRFTIRGVSLRQAVERLREVLS